MELVEITGYYCLFGNIRYPHQKRDDETLQRFWKRMCYISRSTTYGDVSLYFNGKLIRSCMNFNFKVTDRFDKKKRYAYQCVYNKW